MYLWYRKKRYYIIKFIRLVDFQFNKMTGAYSINCFQNLPIHLCILWTLNKWMAILSWWVILLYLIIIWWRLFSLIRRRREQCGFIVQFTYWNYQLAQIEQANDEYWCTHTLCDSHIQSFTSFRKLIWIHTIVNDAFKLKLLPEDTKKGCMVFYGFIEPYAIIQLFSFSQKNLIL